ncbi:MAG: pyridoxal phosphate-dependent aminotransferase [Defluviitaleaceae bacterium]|nr:pyridoxal phosphate-dependent aminotransferase [Defluviitaleaceae bacterium]
MYNFDDKAVKLDILKQRAFNYRWAEVAEDVLPLTAADPDFPAAPQIIEAIKDYLDGGYLSYTPKLGLPEFRQSLAKYLSAHTGANLTPDLVLPIDSAARGMYIIAKAVLKPGDEMLIFDPVDYLFKQACLAANATPVLFPAKLVNGSIDLSELESYITPKTKMIGLCSPHNPFGTLYSAKDMDHILTIAEKHDLWIMNDEIWSDIVFPEGEFVSILSLGAKRNKKTLSVYGFSKSFGVAGLRIGCLYCQDEEMFAKLVDASEVMTTAGGITSLSQIGGIACLEKCRPWVTQFIEHLRQNRDYALQRMEAMPGIKCHKPLATYLLFPDITGTGLNSQEFVTFIEENVRLALVPGVEKFFGPGAEGHVRICFATSRGILTEGMDRLEKGLNLIKRG